MPDSVRDFTRTYIAINDQIESAKNSPFDKGNDYGQKSSSFRQWSDSFRAKNVAKNRLIISTQAKEILMSPEAKLESRSFRIEQ